MQQESLCTPAIVGWGDVTQHCVKAHRSIVGVKKKNSVGKLYNHFGDEKLSLEGFAKVYEMKVQIGTVIITTKEDSFYRRNMVWPMSSRATDALIPTRSETSHQSWSRQIVSCSHG